METIENVIAKRELTFVRNDGERVPCKIVFGFPYKTEDKGYACPYQIVGLEAEAKCGYGADTFQALVTAFEILHVNFCIYKEKGQFFFGKTLVLNTSDILPRDLYS